MRTRQPAGGRSVALARTSQIQRGSAEWKIMGEISLCTDAQRQCSTRLRPWTWPWQLPSVVQRGRILRRAARALQPSLLLWRGLLRSLRNVWSGAPVRNEQHLAVFLLAAATGSCTTHELLWTSIRCSASSRDQSRCSGLLEGRSASGGSHINVAVIDTSSTCSI